MILCSWQAVKIQELTHKLCNISGTQSYHATTKNEEYDIVVVVNDDDDNDDGGCDDDDNDDDVHDDRQSAV